MKFFLLSLVSVVLFVSLAQAQCTGRADLSTQGWNMGGMAMGANTGVSLLTGSITGFVQTTPDDMNVVYRTDAFAGTLELFSVPITGGSPVRISRGLTTGGTVSSYRVINNSKVVYTANAVEMTNREFWMVGVAGGASSPLNPVTTDGKATFMNRNTEFDYTNDAANIYFRGNFNPDMAKTQMELYSAPISGAARGKRISHEAATPATNDVMDYIVGTSRVVYRGDVDTDNDTELWSTALAAQDAKKLNIVKAGSTVDPPGPTGYQFTPDQANVLFVGNQNMAVTGKELYSSPVAAGPGKRISAANPGTAAFTRYQQAGSRVVYQANFNMMNPGDSLLWTTAPTTEDVKVVSVPKTAGGSVQGDWVADATNIHFRAALETAHGNNALYQAVTTADTKMNNRISQDGMNGSVTDFKRATSRVVYRGNLVTGQGTELFATDLTMENVANLNPTGGSPATHMVEMDYDPSNDAQVIFRGKFNADAAVTNVELYSNSLNGKESTAVRLANVADPATDKTGHDVTEFRFVPNRSRLVFKGGLTFGNTPEIYSVAPAGPADSAVKINDGLNEGRMVGKYDVTADSSRAVFLADPTGIMVLFAELVLPALPNTRLSKVPLVSPGAVTDFRLVAGGSRAFYNGKINNEFVPDLFQVCTGAVATATTGSGTTLTTSQTTAQSNPPTNATTASSVATTSGGTGPSTSASTLTATYSLTVLVLASLIAFLYM